LRTEYLGDQQTYFPADRQEFPGDILATIQ